MTDRRGSRSARSAIAARVRRSSRCRSWTNSTVARGRHVEWNLSDRRGDLPYRFCNHACLPSCAGDIARPRGAVKRSSETCGAAPAGALPTRNCPGPVGYPRDWSSASPPTQLPRSLSCHMTGPRQNDPGQDGCGPRRTPGVSPERLSQSPRHATGQRSAHETDVG